MKWEYAVLKHNCDADPDPAAIWRKEKNDSKGEKPVKESTTTLEAMQRYGENGWELVSTTYVFNGKNLYLLFMFKRPKKDT